MIYSYIFRKFIKTNSVKFISYFCFAYFVAAYICKASVGIAGLFSQIKRAVYVDATFSSHFPV